MFHFIAQTQPILLIFVTNFAFSMVKEVQEIPVTFHCMLRSFWHRLSPHCNRRFCSTTKMEIQLTDREKDLFAVLLGCVKHNNKNTTLRYDTKFIEFNQELWS